MMRMVEKIVDGVLCMLATIATIFLVILAVKIFSVIYDQPGPCDPVGTAAPRFEVEYEENHADDPDACNDDPALWRYAAH